MGSSRFQAFSDEQWARVEALLPGNAACPDEADVPALRTVGTLTVTSCPTKAQLSASVTASKEGYASVTTTAAKTAAVR